MMMVSWQPEICIVRSTNYMLAPLAQYGYYTLLECTCSCCSHTQKVGNLMSVKETYRPFRFCTFLSQPKNLIILRMLNQCGHHNSSYFVCAWVCMWASRIKYYNTKLLPQITLNYSDTITLFSELLCTLSHPKKKLIKNVLPNNHILKTSSNLKKGAPS